MPGSHRRHLPPLDGGLFLTDGGIETSLIFRDGLDLPLFAAVDLQTWRASPRWAAELGYQPDELDRLERKAIALMEELREENEPDGAGFTRRRSPPSPTRAPTWSARSR